MTQDEAEECRWQLLYKAEYSSRYHRRRAAFLKNLDTLLTLVTIIAGASAFGDLVAGSPGWLAKLGAATVTVIGLCQAILQLGAAGMTHTQWLKRWSRLQASISLNTAPSAVDVRQWTEERVAIEEECVAELRALTLDCENVAAKVLGVEGRQRNIRSPQRLLIHFGTFQQRFPLIADE
jgi:hypothetical protein